MFVPEVERDLGSKVNSVDLSISGATMGATSTGIMLNHVILTGNGFNVVV